MSESTPNNIYHQGPAPTRRERHARRREAGKTLTGTETHWGEPPPPEAPPESPEASAAGEAEEAQAERRKYRPNRRAGDPMDRMERRGRYVVAGLAVVVVLYFTALLVTSLRSRGRHGSTPSATATPPAGTIERISREDMAQHLQSWELARNDLTEARRLLKEGDLERAEARLKTSLDRNPEHAASLAALAQVYANMGRYADAEALLLNALARNPDQRDARLLLVSILSAEGEDAAALSLAEWILTRDPYAVEAHQAAASALLHEKQYEKALPHLQRLDSLTGGETVTENNLAVVYTRLGRFGDAETLLRKMVDGRTGNSTTYYNLAACYAQQAKVEDAVETLSLGAAHFGLPVVEGWLKERDFDAVRDAPALSAFLARARAMEGERVPAPTPGGQN